MIELKHGDRVRLASWLHPYDRTTVSVGTVRGYTASYNEDPEVAYARAAKNGHDVAWTVHAGTILLGGAADRKAQAEQEAAELARAVVLTPGDVVLIEGEQFKVHVPQGNLRAVRNSDPIHFNRVPEGTP
jgi:hypothetical protein